MTEEAPILLIRWGEGRYYFTGWTEKYGGKLPSWNVNPEAAKGYASREEATPDFERLCAFHPHRDYALVPAREEDSG